MKDTGGKTIRGLENLVGTITHIRQESTSQRHGENLIIIDTEAGERFRISLSEDQETQMFVNKIISAFRFNPAWRENFRVFTHAHDSVELFYQDGRVGKVDKVLQRFVQALNARGFETTESCEGDKHPMGRPPSITFAKQMPSELESIWTVLGWVNMDGSVSPIPCRGYNHEYRQIFLIILDDWIAGTLDSSTQRYQLSRTAVHEIPPLPPVNETALRDHQASVTKLVKKMNKKGHEATFNDLVRLRCGRDRYSLMKLSELKAALVGDSSIEILEAKIHNTSSLQRALRWRLRGLDLDMVLKKHEVDQALESRALRRKQEFNDSEGAL